MSDDYATTSTADHGNSSNDNVTSYSNHGSGLGHEDHHFHPLCHSDEENTYNHHHNSHHEVLSHCKKIDNDYDDSPEERNSSPFGSSFSTFGYVPYVRHDLVPVIQYCNDDSRVVSCPTYYDQYPKAPQQYKSQIVHKQTTFVPSQLTQEKKKKRRSWFRRIFCM